MSDAAEFRTNAQVCKDLADAARLEAERVAWRRMEEAWLARAAQVEVDYRDSSEPSSLPAGDASSPDERSVIRG
jgi:hypothetical protein